MLVESPLLATNGLYCTYTRLDDMIYDNERVRNKSDLCHTTCGLRCIYNKKFVR